MPEIRHDLPSRSALETGDIGEHERAFLATCQVIYRRYTGSTSPFEELFFSLVSYAKHDNYPTPDDMQRLLDEFSEDWTGAGDAAAAFLRAYPAQLEWIRGFVSEHSSQVA